MIGTCLNWFTGLAILVIALGMIWVTSIFLWDILYEVSSIINHWFKNRHYKKRG